MNNVFAARTVFAKQHLMTDLSEKNVALDADSAFDDHDHAACASVAMSRAEAICAARSARLTPIRRRVLELLWESHQPIGAYDLLERLNATGFSAQPPAVYRALDFLMAQGLAHRIASSSAYIGCAMASHESEEPCAAHFVICRACGRASELADPQLQQALANAAQSIGFITENVTLEISGLCGACQG